MKMHSKVSTQKVANDQIGILLLSSFLRWAS